MRYKETFGTGKSGIIRDGAAGQNSVRVCVKERIQAYLEARSAGVSSEELAAGALGLSGSLTGVAEKVVAAAVDGDDRFRFGPSGLWTFRAAGGQNISDATFVSVGVRTVGEGPSRNLHEVAAVRFTVGGQLERFAPGPVASGGSGSGYDAFSAFSRTAVPTAFRYVGVRRELERWRGRVGGREQLPEGLCLFRMGRHRFPDEALPALESLAEAAKIVHRTGREAEQDALLQAELGTYLLERCVEDGLKTVEDVMRALYPDLDPVRFEAFAFDEAYLDQLPEAAGIYIMRDRDGAVIYVGKSVNLRSRVGTYFSRREARPEKTKRILERIWSVEVEAVGSELEALLLEHRLIQICQPEFNTQTEVHPKAEKQMASRNAILVLPSADADGVELFCLRRGESAQIHARRDFEDWPDVVRQLEDRYYRKFEQKENNAGEAEEMEIVRRWAGQRRDDVNAVDVDGSPLEDVVRILRDTISDCANERWERVWRV